MKKQVHMKKEQLPLFLSVSHLPDLLGVSRSAAYAIVKLPHFPKVRLNGRIVIPRDSLFEWMNEQAMGNRF